MERNDNSKNDVVLESARLETNMFPRRWSLFAFLTFSCLTQRTDTIHGLDTQGQGLYFALMNENLQFILPHTEAPTIQDDTPPKQRHQL